MPTCIYNVHDTESEVPKCHLHCGAGFEMSYLLVNFFILQSYLLYLLHNKTRLALHCTVLPSCEFSGMFREPLPVYSENFMIIDVGLSLNLMDTLKPQSNGPLCSNTVIVGWTLMDGLLHLVQRGLEGPGWAEVASISMFHTVSRLHHPGGSP